MKSLNTSIEIAHRRLQTQHLAGAPLQKPEDVVRWLGAVQSQDYPAAQWALGLRLDGGRDIDVDRAFAEGAILRTHVLRPTWHFVLPDDIRWLLALTAPRVHAFSAYYFRKLELDDALLARSNAILRKALEGGKQLTRPELGAILEREGINTQDGVRLGYIIIHAELDAVICSGAKRGKQHTYALLDERAPNARVLPQDEALAEITLRYFTGHGPATMKDFMWWSSLTGSDAKAGLDMVKSRLIEEVIGSQTYWFAAKTSSLREASPTAYLLPNFDEYAVGYAGRDALYPGDLAETLASQPMVVLGNTVVIDGQIRGSWKRTFTKGTVAVSIQPFDKFTETENEAVAAAAERYGEFLGMPVALS